MAFDTYEREYIRSQFAELKKEKKIELKTTTVPPSYFWRNIHQKEQTAFKPQKNRFSWLRMRTFFTQWKNPSEIERKEREEKERIAKLLKCPNCGSHDLHKNSMHIPGAAFAMGLRGVPQFTFDLRCNACKYYEHSCFGSGCLTCEYENAENAVGIGNIVKNPNLQKLDSHGRRVNNVEDII